MSIRRVANPPNPYVAAHREWLDEPPRVEIELYEERARSILSHNDSPDLPFRHSLNPYRGCQHACGYCYARPTHEYLGLGAGTDFDSKITVKINAPELLRAELARPSWRHEGIAFSGVTDCYQPLEVVYRLTRRCLEICGEFETPFSIVTKSFLVARDAELLASVRRSSGVHVYMSIAFADDALARRVEPGAPPPSRRFEAMRRLRDAGVPVSVFVAPIIPGLNDREIAKVLAKAAACGAESAGYTALRLPGSVRDVFLARLREALPHHAARVEARIRDIHGGKLNEWRFGKRMNGEGTYWRSVKQLFEQSARRAGLRVAGARETGQESGESAACPRADAGCGSVQLPLFSE
ncbi:MAG: PA0069 family radical SAM protein [Phycisphaerae bacterium]